MMTQLQGRSAAWFHHLQSLFSHTSCDYRTQEWSTLDRGLALPLVIFLWSVGLFTHSRYLIFHSSDFIRSVCFLLPCCVGSCSAMVLLSAQLYILSAACLWYRSIAYFRTSKDKAACLQQRRPNYVDRFGRWGNWSPWCVLKPCSMSLPSTFL